MTASVSVQLSVLLSLQALLWEWATETVPATDLKLDQSASVSMHPSAERLLLRRWSNKYLISQAFAHPWAVHPKPETATCRQKIVAAWKTPKEQNVACCKGVKNDPRTVLAKRLEIAMAKGIATANLGRVVLSKEAWRTSKHTIIASLRI